MRSLKLLAVCIVLFAVVLTTFAARRALKPERPVVPNVVGADGRLTLPNGWRLTPAGRSVPLPGDMPLKMIVSKGGRYLVVTTGGFHDHDLNVIDLKGGKLVQSVDLFNVWDGLAIDEEGDDLYVSGGGPPKPDRAAQLTKKGVSPADVITLSKPIYRLSFEDGKATLKTGFELDAPGRNGHFTAGLIAGSDEALYAVDVNGDAVYKLGGHPRRVLGGTAVGYRPLALALSPDGKTLAVSNWGDRSVSLLDPETLAERTRVTVGSHPNELAFSPDGRLFVANSGSNSVSVLRGSNVTEAISTSIEPRAPVGSTPDALTIAPDGKRLYVANADNNDVAVVDIGGRGSRVLGFIPTGWYPTALAISPDGKKLFVGNGKGLTFGRNFPAAIKEPDADYNGKTRYDYIGDMLSGSVSIVDVPNAVQLAAYTRQVRANLPLPVTASATRTHVDEVTRGAFAHIKHVLFIIRENRTYDQVMGDLPNANGDPNLTIFGERVTPNAHAITRWMTTLDNLYCNGEVSEDGHEWCNAAYATDDREKGWSLSYAGRREPDVDTRLTGSPGGYLWDNCARHGLSYRSYGEFTEFKASRTGRPVYTGNHALDGHACVDWWRMDNVKDARDMNYAGVFIKELRAAERTGKWPAYMVMSLGEDHTNGLKAGQFTPFSCVAANDLGLGQLVEAVSRSRFWKETAIFVIEDDAQDGPDHVDAHRTVGLVISPYVRRGYVDSTMYSTASMVRTMELILKLPPMSQFDEHATPMFNAFTTTPDFTSFTALPARIDLSARNPKTGEGAKQSAMLDFSKRDRADPQILNRLLWNYARPGVPMPAPVRAFASR